MRRLRTTLAATTLFLAAGVGLAGCATADDYHPTAAERLQERVLGATTAAASADYATVLSALDALEVDLGDALARGQITQARHDAITAAIAHVRKDVEATIAAQQPAPEPEPQQQPEQQPSGEGSKPEKEKPAKEKPEGEKPGKPDAPGKPENPGNPGKGRGNEGGPGNGKGND